MIFDEIRFISPLLQSKLTQERQLIIMNHFPSNTFTQQYTRTPFQRPLTIQQAKMKQKIRYNSDVRFHAPYERLARRKIFSDTIKRLVKDDQILKLDNFVLFDAVAKRGGFMQVCNRNRWDQISACLSYQKKIWRFPKYYQDNLLPLQSQLLHACPWYNKNIVSQYEYETFQIHLLPPNNLTTSYYIMNNVENLFAEESFFSMDQYYNIKSLVISGASTAKIPAEYAEKYIILKKFLLLSGQIRESSQEELKLLGISDTKEQIKVAIVGISLPNLLLADKLSDFGVHVVLIDKTKREARSREQFHAVQTGIMLFEGNSKGSYLKYMEQNSVLLSQIVIPGSGMLILDEQGKPYSQERIRISQQMFFGIIQELKGEVMSKKNLYEQVITRMHRRKLQSERFLIKWHYDRYMTVNRIKGDATVVSDLANYQNKKFVKHISQSSHIYVLQSMQKLHVRVRQKKNVSIVQSQIDQIAYVNDRWNIHTRSSETITSSHLVYSDQQNLYKSIFDGTPKLSEFSSDILGENLNIFQQLTAIKYINCLFRFRQKVLLKQSLKNQTCFSISCVHGFIYFFLLNNGSDIYAILKCYHNTSINYYTEVLSVLQSKCLIKSNRLINEQLYGYEYTFGIKDEKYIEPIIKITQKMFLLLPITTTNCPHKITAQMDMVNYISSHILDEAYPNYHQYDQSLKNRFASKIIENISPAKPQPSPSLLQRPPKEKQSNIQLTQSLSVQSSRNINTSEQTACKLRYILAIANDTAQPVAINDGEIPSIFQLSQLENDWFGINHPYVKNYELFLKQKIEGGCQVKQAITRSILFEIKQPIFLSEHTVLHSLGSPYYYESNWFTPFLQQKNIQNYLFILNGLVSRREYISVLDTLKTSIYYQTIILIDNEVYYCMVQQSCKSIIYYHKNLNVLAEIFNRELDLLRKEALLVNPTLSKNYVGASITRCKFQQFPPQDLVPSVIERQIRKQNRLYEGVSLDKVLQQKIKKRVASNKISKYMSASYRSQIIETTRLSSSTSTSIYVQSTFAEILANLKKSQTAFDIKPFTLFQSFFGILNEQYMACEIMKKLHKDPLSYLDLQKFDEPLSKQIQQLFSKEIPNQMFKIMIVPQQKCVFFHRNFLSMSREESFQRYTYLRMLEKNGMDYIVRSYFIDGNGNKMEFTDTSELMKEIIRLLLMRYRKIEVVQYFQDLLYHDLKQQENLPARVKLYYKMTKKVKKTNPQSTISFKDKVNTLNQLQKASLNTLLCQKRVHWIENDFIFIVK